MKVYKIPSNDYTSYLAVEPSTNQTMLYHSGNVKQMQGTMETLMGGSKLLTTPEGLKFIIPTDLVNYSFPPSLLNIATVLVRESSQNVVRVVLQAVKADDPNAIRFTPSKTFKGSRPGYVFTTRDGRTGYYLDKRELAKYSGQVFENPRCEGGVCALEPVEPSGPAFENKMFQPNVADKTPSTWSATGETIYSKPVTDFSGRESMLYNQQLKSNERAVGPDSLPMQFQ